MPKNIKQNVVINTNPTGRRERHDTGIKWESYIKWESGRFRSSIGWNYINKSQEFRATKSVLPSPSIGNLGIPDNKAISLH